MLVVEHYDRIDRNVRERQLYFLRIFTNILGDSKKKTLYEDKLYEFAYFDETTKLANRNMLKMRLDHKIRGSDGSGKIAVLVFELENLRVIKDTFGHNLGEQVMIKSATILKNLLDESCEIARTGEGDFVVVLPTVENNEQVLGCAERLLKSFSRPISTGVGKEALFVVPRLGVSMYPDDGKDADTLLKNADLAVYEAKNIKEEIIFYTERPESHIAENILYTNRLFESLQNEEFFLEYQPQINCDTGKTVGIEALLRWTSDGTTRVGPDRFIPILEQTGLIYDVGLWVLEQALREHNRLIANGFPPLRVSVNLSVVQFHEEDFILDLTKIIKESQVDPRYLELEITESLFSEKTAEILVKLNTLKEMGVRIAVDDFGKGYSSLNRLRLVPFDRIKIDKEITDNIDVDNKAVSITENIVSLAKAFNASITAEGVETKEKAEFLKSLGCDEIQGYYYSKPLSAEALEGFLEKA
jgi:diguanylate cyclase (GGDEF)-like protein